MTFTILQKDLFTLPKTYALCHCISSDIAMGKGIALKFREMGVRTQILSELKGQGTWDGNGYCVPVTTNGQRIYNLVTKERYYNKPTLKTLTDALQSMKDMIVKENTKQLAMPLIGCGLDRLNWADVQSIIQSMFKDIDIEIIVCKL